jgi:hypothetical protein
MGRYERSKSETQCKEIARIMIESDKVNFFQWLLNKCTIIECSGCLCYQYKEGTFSATEIYKCWEKVKHLVE